jgi:phospholipid/cholesterol/gamma-HCH transport system substrate-binding protein
MDERIMQLRVGLMVLFVAGLIAILLWMFGGQGTLVQYFQGKQVFYIQFPEAPEVTPDTPVQKSGVRIGRVSRVQLADEVTDVEMDPDMGVLVTVEIDHDRKIFTDEVCRIKRNLLGDAVLEFVRAKVDERETEDEGEREGEGEGEGKAPSADPAGTNGGSSQADSLGNPTSEPPGRPYGDPERKPHEVIESGAVLRGKVQADPIQVVGNLEQDLSDAITSVARTSDEIRVLVQKASGFMGPMDEMEAKQQRLRNILEASLETMKQMRQLAENANDVIGDEVVRQDVKDAVGQFPGVLRDARDTLGQMSHTFQTTDETVRRVNVTLGSIERFAQRLDEQGGTMIDRLDRSAETLEVLMGELLALTQSLNSQEGTLGRLVRDPKLYHSLNDAVTNLEDLTRRLRPVVDNARVFSDKIARHPELLGVRGALQQSPGTKGVPRLPQLRGTADLSQPPHYRAGSARPR